MECKLRPIVAAYFSRTSRSRRFGTPLSDAEHRLPGSGWQRGESMSSIGRVFDRGSSSIYPLFERTGGIRPADRIRSRLALTLTDREETSRGLRAQMSLRSIARSLKRSASTISREVRRNGGIKDYRAAPSDVAAWDRSHSPKLCKLAGRLSLSTARQHMLACVRGGDIDQADPHVVPATNRRLADARTSR
jgi:hypothetical protein